MNQRVEIEASWKMALEDEWSKDYFIELSNFIESETSSGKTIYPKRSNIYHAFKATPFDQVKVMILGQDPYHSAGQAMGLSFSVPMGTKVPASLKRIYKELARDLDFVVPDHGDLSSWSEQGVFLLNAMLTVEAGMPGSHKKAGWQNFTDAVIRKLSDEKEGLIFMLWGNFAKAKKSLIDTEKHFVLEAAHPSPLAGNTFQECGHFSKANEILREHGKQAINWQV